MRKSILKLSFIVLFGFSQANANAQSLEDIDGNVYKTVKIGTQEWMTENLKATALDDGSTIMREDNGREWAMLEKPAYSWYPEGNDYLKYGAYYNYEVVKTDDICPLGWKVPSNDDFKVLKQSLENDSLNWKKMHDAGFFNTRSGFRHKEAGDFFDVDESSIVFWSSTVYDIRDDPEELESMRSIGISVEKAAEDNGRLAWQISLDYYPNEHFTSATLSSYFSKNGLGIRCVRTAK